MQFTAIKSLNRSRESNSTKSFPLDCDTLRAMHRALNIFVIIALLSAPLPLLARSASADAASCGGVCCLLHHAPHGDGSPYSGSHTRKHESDSCDHGAAEEMPNCAMNCRQAAPDYGLSSPVAPTKPSNLASISRLNPTKTVKLQSAPQNVSAGFLAAPFRPPRA
jgi:hypothetical protein